MDGDDLSGTIGVMLLSATCTACTKYGEHRYKQYVQSSESVGQRCWLEVLVEGVGRRCWSDVLVVLASVSWSS